jgi:hypothetical protein
MPVTVSHSYILLYKTNTCHNQSLKYGFIPDTYTDKDTRDMIHRSIKAPIMGTGIETCASSYVMIITINGHLGIWLAVHHSVTFLLVPTWYTNFLFIYTNYIKLNSSTCFECTPPIIRRSTTQIVHMQPLVLSLSAGDCSPSLVVAQDSHLQRVTIPEAGYVQFALLTSWWWAECAWNM